MEAKDGDGTFLFSEGSEDGFDRCGHWCKFLRAGKGSVKERRWGEKVKSLVCGAIVCLCSAFMKTTSTILILDFDDLLVNSCPLHDRAFGAALAAARVKGKIPPELYTSYFGLRIIDISRRLKSHFGFAMPLDEFVRMHDARFIEIVKKELETMPGAQELAQLIRKNGWRRALASSGTREYLTAGLKKIGFDNFFEAIASGDEVDKGKPAPDIFLKAAEKMKAAPSACIVIEDSQSGIEAASRAGMRCIGVRNPFSAIPQNLSNADAIVASLADVDENLLSSLKP